MQLSVDKGDSFKEDKQALTRMDSDAWAELEAEEMQLHKDRLFQVAFLNKKLP